MSDECPKCGSTNSKFVTVHENEYGRSLDLKCNDCGQYFTIDEEGDMKE